MYRARIEALVERAVPYAILLLIPLILIELVFGDRIGGWLLAIHIADGIIIGILAVDLGFRFQRAASIRGFVRTYWLDILALLPVFVVLRVVEEVALLAQAGEMVQGAAGEAAAVQRETRLERFRQYFRPLARSPRLLRAFTFYARDSRVHTRHSLR